MLVLCFFKNNLTFCFMLYDIHSFLSVAEASTYFSAVPRGSLKDFISANSAEKIKNKNTCNTHTYIDDFANASHLGI